MFSFQVSPYNPPLMLQQHLKSLKSFRSASSDIPHIQVLFHFSPALPFLPYFHLTSNCIRCPALSFHIFHPFTSLKERKTAFTLSSVPKVTEGGRCFWNSTVPSAACHVWLKSCRDPRDVERPTVLLCLLPCLSPSRCGCGCERGEQMEKNWITDQNTVKGKGGEVWWCLENVLALSITHWTWWLSI